MTDLESLYHRAPDAYAAGRQSASASWRVMERRVVGLAFACGVAVGVALVMWCR